MSIKDTLTNNSMNSFSFGGKTYTRRVDNGAVVYDISAGTDGSAFSTGWVDQDASGTDVANGANLTFVHNLGTTDIVTSAFVNSTASDTNAQQIPVHEVGTYNHGYAIVDMDANSITVNLADDGYFDVNSSGGGTYTSLSAKFFKLVIVAKMGSGGGGGTPAGSDRELQFNDNGVFGTNSNLSIDAAGNLSVPRLAVGVGNFAGDEGGEIALRQSETNNTLVGNWVYMDVFQNKIRFFEDGLPYKGAYIDLTECADGVATNLLAGGSGGGGGGGYIDSGFVNTNTSTTYQFPDWNNDTQVIFFFATDPDGQGRYGIVPEATNYTGGATAGTYGTVGGSGNSRKSYVWRNATGLVSSSDGYSGNTSQSITLYRWAKGSASGGSSGGGASVTTDPTAPTNPSDGDLWYDEDSAALYVYTDSIGGWIQANGGGGSGAGTRAYVAFDGTSSNLTGSITNSFNVSSITDHQAGQYTVTFTSPVPNPVAVHDNGERSDGYPILYSDLYNVGSNSIKIGLGSNNLWYDSTYISLMVF